MFWADQMGLDKALETIRGYHETGQEVFEPAPLIERLVAEGKTFADLDRAESRP
jgi:3-hydroxyacyl-CoA dehydrogenase